MMSLLLILKMSYLEDREIEMQCYTYFESLKFSRASKCSANSMPRVAHDLNEKTQTGLALNEEGYGI